MKRLYRFLFWILAVVVLMLLTAHFTLRHALNTPKFKTSVLSYIERATGRPADYERIDYTLFPFSLVIRRAAVKEADGDRDFVALKSFSVVVDWRKKEITSLILDEPFVRVVQTADGLWNFSDLLPAPGPRDAAEPADATGEPPSASPPAPAKEKPAELASPPLSIRLVRISGALFEYTRLDDSGEATTLTVSDLDFTLTDFAPDLPLQIRGQAAVGEASSVAFTFSAPPPGDYASRIEEWPLDITAKLNLSDANDLAAFLPPDTLPVQGLRSSLALKGSLAEQFRVELDLETSLPTEDFPAAANVQLQAELRLPLPIAQHLISGVPLPAEWAYDPPPCTPPDGAMSLHDSPAALVLRHLQATVEATIPSLTYGSNQLTDGDFLVYLRGGVLTFPKAVLSAYGGQISARGNAQLLTCPLSYRLEELTIRDLSIEQVLAAHEIPLPSKISGILEMDAHLSGHAVAEAGLNSLAAAAALRVRDVHSVGTGGSLMDQVWLHLDHPLVLKLLPRVQPKVEHARHAAGHVTTSRYEDVTADLTLRDGVATLSNTRLALPDYRLQIEGTMQPFDDRMDLDARLIVSPAETLELTAGKDLSERLPYEDGGLMVPFVIEGSLTEPRVLPNLEILLSQALSGTKLADEIMPRIENLSESDKMRIDQGLKALGKVGKYLK